MKNFDDDNFPSIFYCPITRDLFQHPVLAQDGQTYDRNAIKTWLRNNNTSPMRSHILPNKQLITNWELISQMEETGIKITIDHPEPYIEGKIHVKTLQGKTYSFDYNPDTTITEYKNLYFATNGIPVSQQAWVSHGKILANNKTLDNYEIPPEGTIYIVEKMRRF